MKKIVFLAPAEEELFDAASYYNAQADGLGDDFIAKVESVVHRIAENPRSGKIVRGEIRRYLIRRFPFGILYRIDPEEIVIIAVMHLRRRPGYWKRRKHRQK
ncbi:plasmid stabilization protein [candidate division LCP-89 bacterium B3_LCP]|uniref:Plasmid stabilization protein n=1 Tax=candidate division LCP-89 bacterium B3_LCP TaxID=2012998 RepID=A0A532USS3_UNCL8|nr:MAG: plasmid stabilization protein [candidate division LCP-89 bacterium B3_LCP]